MDIDLILSDEYQNYVVECENNDLTPQSELEWKVNNRKYFKQLIANNNYKPKTDKSNNRKFIDIAFKNVSDDIFRNIVDKLNSTVFVESPIEMHANDDNLKILHIVKNKCEQLELSHVKSICARIENLKDEHNNQQNANNEQSSVECEYSTVLFSYAKSAMGVTSITLAKLIQDQEIRGDFDKGVVSIDDVVDRIQRAIQRKGNKIPDNWNELLVSGAIAQKINESPKITKSEVEELVNKFFDEIGNEEYEDCELALPEFDDDLHIELFDKDELDVIDKLDKSNLSMEIAEMNKAFESLDKQHRNYFYHAIHAAKYKPCI